MKHSLFKLIPILFFLFAAHKSHATAQIGDILITNNDTAWINSNPLEPYLKKKDSRTIGGEGMGFVCTALWRGYVATWELQNDSIFLIRVQINYCGDDKIDLDIVKEFGSNKVFAYWVDHTIIKPEGHMLQYVHMGYGSIYQGETYYTFEKGLLTNTKHINYLQENDTLLFPGTHFLQDTIRSIILKSLSRKERNKCRNWRSCRLQISFNKKGELSEISIAYGREPKNVMEKIIFAKAQETLKNLPPLMKVNHKNYIPPTITLWFSGHCVKHPYDRKYGCNYE